MEIVTPEEAATINNEAERMFERAYHELIYAVGNKYPGETRHETALRYIREAELRCEECAFCGEAIINRREYSPA